MGRPKETTYRAYLLRLRRTDGTYPTWRASLDEVATGERHTFALLDEMFAWLREETRGGDSAPPDSLQGTTPDEDDEHISEMGQSADH